MPLAGRGVDGVHLFQTSAPIAGGRCARSGGERWRHGPSSASALFSSASAVSGSPGRARRAHATPPASPPSLEAFEAEAVQATEDLLGEIGVRDRRGRDRGAIGAPRGRCLEFPRYGGQPGYAACLLSPGASRHPPDREGRGLPNGYLLSTSSGRGPACFGFGLGGSTSRTPRRRQPFTPGGASLMSRSS